MFFAQSTPFSRSPISLNSLLPPLPIAKPIPPIFRSPPPNLKIKFTPIFSISYPISPQSRISALYVRIAMHLTSQFAFFIIGGKNPPIWSNKVIGLPIIPSLGAHRLLPALSAFIRVHLRLTGFRVLLSRSAR